MASTKKVLLVANDEALRSSLYPSGDRASWTVLHAASVAQGLSVLSVVELDAVVFDARAFPAEGPDFLRRACAVRPEAVPVLLSSAAHEQATLAALETGTVRRFLVEPFGGHEIAHAIDHELSKHDAAPAAPVRLAA